MKKETQARRQNSAAASSNQTSNPAVAGGPTVEECLKGINEAVREIDCQFANASGEYEQIFSLNIRMHLSPLLDGIEPVSLPSPASAPSRPETAQESGNQAATPVRQADSGLEPGKQPSAPGDNNASAEPSAAKVYRALSDLLAVIDEAVEDAESTGEKLRLLMIRQSAEEVQGDTVLLIGAEARAGAPEQTDLGEPAPDLRPFTAGPKTKPNFKPFGPAEPPDDTNLARMSLLEAWKKCEGMEFHDAVANLFDFCNCIKNAQWLQMEAAAIDFLGHVSNELGDLRGGDLSKLTAAERWIHDRIKEKPNATFTETVAMLSQAEPLLRENPASVGLADIIANMNRWINVIVDVEKYVDTI